MIRIGNYPEGMTVDEVNEYLKMFCSMHPYERSGDLNILLDGDYVDLYLTNAENVPFQRVRRVTGYLTGDVRRWNDAKQAELKDRVKHGTGGNANEI